MKLNECPSEHSSYGRHCSCIRERRSTQCCHCGHVVRKYESRQMTLCVRWIYEDDLELQSEIPKYCDHGYCRGGTGYTMEITIERLPSGNYIMRNEHGYLLCEVIDGSELAKFVEEHLERGLFTLMVESEKP